MSSFNQLPASFFGSGYSVAAGAITLANASDTTGVTVGGTFISDNLTNTIVTTANHGLVVGDRVRVVRNGSGLVEDTNYWVRSTPSGSSLTLAETYGGSLVDLQTDSLNTNTLQAMGPLDEVTDAEADLTTGDWRKVVFGIMEMLNSKWNGTPVGDRPRKLSIFRNINVDQITGETIYNYSVACRVAVQAMEIVSE